MDWERQCASESARRDEKAYGEKVSLFPFRSIAIEPSSPAITVSDDRTIRWKRRDVFLILYDRYMIGVWGI